ncbi:MAG TPA: hypothetical protein VLC09_03865 [Polyangiaceae bacterium]|nr:hypothetical protein [Polyangiaceae bacterium]
MSDQIEVNGNIYSWGSIIIKLDGVRFYGFTAVSYGDKRERVKQYGMGKAQAPRGRSRGKYTVDVTKIKGPVRSVQDLREALAAKSENGKSYGDVEMEVIVQFVETGEKPMNVQIQRCVWASNAASYSEGPDGLEEEFELDAMRILRNGLTLFDSQAA